MFLIHTGDAQNSDGFLKSKDIKSNEKDKHWY